VALFLEADAREAFEDERIVALTSACSRRLRDRRRVEERDRRRVEAERRLRDQANERDEALQRTRLRLLS
jgi:hypothetical protein